jgi:hypothetical protein
MQHFTRYGLFFAALAAMTLLTVSVRKHSADSADSSRPIKEWDIPELAVHLNRMGVEVRLRAVPKKGPLIKSAYLTFTTKEWHDLNALNKDPRHFQEWRGTLYCERVGEHDSSYLIDQWGDRSMAVGPFLFYGDTELLDRVRTVLAPLAADPWP